MDVKERAIIQKNFSYLLNCLDVHSVRFHLYEKFVLKQNDMDVLSKINTTMTEKNEMLLIHILPKRGPKAYTEFLNALKEDGHHPHIVETLENTVLSDEDLQRAIEYEPPETPTEKLEGLQFYIENSEKVKCGNETFSIQWDLNQLYGKGKILSAAKMENVQLGDPGIEEEVDLNKLFNNVQSHSVEDKPSGIRGKKWQKCNGLETFSVTLKKTETSDWCGFHDESYVLYTSMEGVALISRTDYARANDVEGCPQKALWPFDVIRRYASDKNRILIEVGEAACTGEGRFIFKTEKAEDAQKMVSVIKRYIQIFSENQNPLYKSIRRPSVQSLEMNI